jgi:hypothetical protein
MQDVRAERLEIVATMLLALATSAQGQARRLL